MDLKFNGFRKYTRRPNMITNGTLFTRRIKIPFSKEPNRILRVWLPMGYDGEKRYPVFYFCDGQNMVDKYTTAYGEWNLEDHIYELQQKGYDGVILVGIDCPIDPAVRESEYMPDIAIGNPRFKAAVGEERLGDKMADYFVHKIKPLIDRTFMTKRQREFTGAGGSSMGGLFSFYMANKYPKVFSMSLSFSPAFLLYKMSSLISYVDSVKDNDVKVVFFSGKKEKLEYNIFIYTKFFYTQMRKMKFNMNNVKLIIDKKEIHHESAWSKYSLEAFEFLLPKLVK